MAEDEQEIPASSARVPDELRTLLDRAIADATRALSDRIAALEERVAGIESREVTRPTNSA